MGTVGVGGITAWATSLTQTLSTYAPLSWVASALISSVLFMLGYWFWANARVSVSRRQFVQALHANTTAINPLAKSFEKARIKISDLIDPFDRSVRNKTFTDCDLIGPANILFEGVGNLTGMAFSNCDLVMVNKNFVPNTVIRFSDVHMVGGRIIGAAIFVTPGMKLAMGAMANAKDANWVNT